MYSGISVMVYNQDSLRPEELSSVDFPAKVNSSTGPDDRGVLRVQVFSGLSSANSAVGFAAVPVTGTFDRGPLRLPPVWSHSCLLLFR